MVATLNFKNSTVTLNLLDGTNYAVADGGLQRPPPMSRRVFGGQSLLRDGADLIEQVYENREVTVRLYVKGTSQDNLIANIRAIEKMIDDALVFSTKNRGTQVTLEEKWTDATVTVAYHVLHGSFRYPRDFFQKPWLDTAKRIGLLGSPCVLTLICKPFARGTQESAENYGRDTEFEVAGTALADWTENKTATGTTARDTTKSIYGSANLKLVMTDSGAGAQWVSRYQ
jgi:hypothetical protein